MENPQHPVFMSYAWDDNVSPNEVRGAVGWINYFKNNVEAGLKETGIKDLHLWRDRESYSDNQEFEREIKAAMKRAVFLVAIVSDNFLQSNWCPRELRIFKDDISRRRGAFDREWIVKVLKQRVPRDSLDEYLGGRLGFSFYDEAKADGSPFFYLGRLKENYQQQYLDAVEKVVNELKRLRQAWLEETKQPRKAGGFAAPPQVSSTSGVVYIARPATDGREQYLKLIGEMRARKYDVVPDPEAAIPERGPDAEAFFAAALHQSLLAIHSVTSTGGMRPENSDSIVRMQLRLAGERARATPSFRRIIWLPRSTTSDDPEHQRLIDGLRAGVDAQLRLYPSDDRVEADDFERFRDEVINILTADIAGATEGARKSSKARMIYALCASEDDKLVAETVEPILYAKGYDVMLPLREGSEEDQRREHQRCMTSSDCVLVVWGEASEGWIRNTLAELEAVSASHQPVLLKLSPGKMRFRKQGMTVLAPSASSLKACLEEYFAAPARGP